jgi:hypothetical protein
VILKLLLIEQSGFSRVVEIRLEPVSTTVAIATFARPAEKIIAG